MKWIKSLILVKVLKLDHRGGATWKWSIWSKPPLRPSWRLLTSTSWKWNTCQGQYGWSLSSASGKCGCFSLFCTCCISSPSIRSLNKTYFRSMNFYQKTFLTRATKGPPSSLLSSRLVKWWTNFVINKAIRMIFQTIPSRTFLRLMTKIVPIRNLSNCEGLKNRGPWTDWKEAMKTIFLSFTKPSKVP